MSTIFYLAPGDDPTVPERVNRGPSDPNIWMFKEVFFNLESYIKAKKEKMGRNIIQNESWPFSCIVNLDVNMHVRIKVNVTRNGVINF